MKVAVKISDVKLHLTQVQYQILISLFQSVSRVFSSSDSSHVNPIVSPSLRLGNNSVEAVEQRSTVNLEPEVRSTPAIDRMRPWTTVDVVASVKAVKLHLYDAGANTESKLQDHGIVQVSLNSTTLRYKSLSDGAFEAQLVLESFTMSNTRPGGSRFREIIPAADHGRNQFMVLYTSSGTSSLAIVTVDAPHIIFAIEPSIALISFFASVPGNATDTGQRGDVVNDMSQQTVSRSGTDIRVELHDISISVLEDDSNAQSHAIRLYIDQIILSQQVRAMMGLKVLVLTTPGYCGLDHE